MATMMEPTIYITVEQKQVLVSAVSLLYELQMRADNDADHFYLDDAAKAINRLSMILKLGE